MAVKGFYLLGESSQLARDIEVESSLDMEELQHLIAGHFAIVEPSDIAFQSDESPLSSVPEILAYEEPIAITVDGKPIRDIPGPKGLPLVGNFLEIYPDHLGNHQRLFEQYGPIFQTTTMGRTVYHTNDPQLSQIVFAESDFFTKRINESHPLYPIKNKDANVFLADTEWRTTHKFLPLALGPKAVCHYAPTMQQSVEDAFSGLDHFDKQGEKLPTTSLIQALVVTTGAGFTTTGSLLSWLIYSLVTYPGIQERLLQELIDHNINADTQITVDLTDQLTFNGPLYQGQRRHNPSYQPARTAKVDMILPRGYKLPQEVKTFLLKLVYRYKFTRENDGLVEYDPKFQLIRPIYTCEPNGG